MTPSAQDDIHEASAVSAMSKDEVLIEYRDVMTHFHIEEGVVRAVDGIDLVLRENRTLGVVGESGCGKSVLALTTLGLVPKPPAVVSGQILFHNRDGTVVDLASLNPRGGAIRRIRGCEISMIFQEPMTSLNPVITIGHQITEAIRLHQHRDEEEARCDAIEMLHLVEIPEPEQRFSEYPHQLSGGMRQRAMIAMALSCRPRLLIADEPTTALDVTIQAQILELMGDLQRRTSTSIMIITHDLGVVAGMADEVAVVYLGQIVEYGSVRQVFKRHRHPYTEGLLSSIPILGRSRGGALKPIKGIVPDPRRMPAGCRFNDRCPFRFDRCDQPPPLFEIEDGHQARCWLNSPEVPHGQ